MNVKYFEGNGRDQTTEWLSFVDEVTRGRMTAYVKGPIHYSRPVSIANRSDWSFTFLGTQGTMGHGQYMDGLVYTGDRGPAFSIEDCNRWRLLGDVSLTFTQDVSNIDAFHVSSSQGQRGDVVMGRLGVYSCLGSAFTFTGDCLEHSVVEALITRKCFQSLFMNCHAMDNFTVKRCHFTQNSSPSPFPVIDIVTCGNIHLEEINVAHCSLREDVPTIRLHGGLPFISRALIEQPSRRALDLTWTGVNNSGVPLHRNNVKISCFTCSPNTKDANDVSARVNRWNTVLEDCSFPGTVEHRGPLLVRGGTVLSRHVHNFTRLHKDS